MKTILSVLFPLMLSRFAIADLVNKETDPSEAIELAEKKVQEFGEHQGKLVTTGNYSLEVVWGADSSVKIYLLDAEFKNQTVQNSEVGVFIQSGNTESEMSCQSVENSYFECKQSGKKFKKGELAIASKRNGAQGQEVKMKVPFEMKPDVSSGKIDKLPQTNKAKKKK